MAEKLALAITRLSVIESRFATHSPMDGLSSTWHLRQAW
jgi:hypothetical protein